jgi:hypothetical protein
MIHTSFMLTCADVSQAVGTWDCVTSGLCHLVND